MDGSVIAPAGMMTKFGYVNSTRKTVSGLNSADHSPQLMRKISGNDSRLKTLARLPTFPEPLTGLFLCGEPDQAVLTMAFHKLGSNPVETPSNLTAIIGVLVTVESFEQEHPLVRAEMDGLSWLSHEWVRCLWWIVPVRF